MKKFMLFAAAASAALVGCVNDETMEMTSDAQKITFDNPVMATQTRAYYGEITGAQYPTAENFKVFAKQHKGALTDWDSADNFWSNPQEAKYDATLQYWDTDQDYYWPSSDDNEWLSFAAYSPAVLTGNKVAASYSNTGLSITGFEVNPTVSGQVDLMYSGPVLDCSYTDENDVNGVDLNFKHALSSIVFSAIDVNDAAQYTINSISVKGGFLTKGDFNEGLTSITATSGTPAWSNATSTTGQTYSLATGLNTSVNTAATVITEGKSALLTIPHTTEQLTAAAPEVTINYTVSPTTGAKTYTATKTVKLSDFKTAENNAITEWKVGTRYVYQFKFGTTAKIYFTPTVTDWADGGTAIIEIK